MGKKNVDLLQLNNQQRLVAAIDEDGGLHLSGLDHCESLTVLEAARLKDLLVRNEWRLLLAFGGQTAGEQIGVWWPRFGRQIVDDKYSHLMAVIEVGAGTLYFFGWHSELREIFYVGFTPDAREFVLVPQQLYLSRFRELLVQLVGEALGTADPHRIAATIEAIQGLYDSASPTNELIERAHREARQVAYWRELAGNVPCDADPRDARRPQPPKQFRYSRSRRQRGTEKQNAR